MKTTTNQHRSSFSNQLLVVSVLVTILFSLATPKRASTWDGGNGWSYSDYPARAWYLTTSSNGFTTSYTGTGHINLTSPSFYVSTYNTVLSFTHYGVMCGGDASLWYYVDGTDRLLLHTWHDWDATNQLPASWQPLQFTANLPDSVLGKNVSFEFDFATNCSTSVSWTVTNISLTGDGSYTNPIIIETTNTLPKAMYNVDYGSVPIVISGGISPYTVSVSWGSLPPGMTPDSSTYMISGTPTASGLYNFILKIQDSYTVPAFKELLYNLYVQDETTTVVTANDQAVYGPNGTFTASVTENSDGQLIPNYYDRASDTNMFWPEEESYVQFKKDGVVIHGCEKQGVDGGTATCRGCKIDCVNGR